MDANALNERCEQIGAAALKMAQAAIGETRISRNDVLGECLKLAAGAASLLDAIEREARYQAEQREARQVVAEPRREVEIPAEATHEQPGFASRPSGEGAID